MGKTQSSKGDTFDAFSKLVTGVIAGIKLNLANNRTLPIGGTTVTAVSVTNDLQGYVDHNAAVDKSKGDTKALVVARQKLKAAVKKELSDFTKWAVLQFGEAAYKMFALPSPKPSTRSTTKKAIGIAKATAKAKAKAAAKAAAAAATPQETLVAYDVSGNPIGGAPPAPAVNAAGAPAAPTPTVSVVGAK